MATSIKREVKTEQIVSGCFGEVIEFFNSQLLLKSEAKAKLDAATVDEVVAYEIDDIPIKKQLEDLRTKFTFPDLGTFGMVFFIKQTKKEKGTTLTFFRQYVHIRPDDYYEKLEQQQAEIH